MESTETERIFKVVRLSLEDEPGMKSLWIGLLQQAGGKGDEELVVEFLRFTNILKTRLYRRTLAIFFAEKDRIMASLVDGTPIIVRYLDQGSGAMVEVHGTPLALAKDGEILRFAGEEEKFFTDVQVRSIKAVF